MRILDDDISFLQNVKGDSSYLNYYYTTLFYGKTKLPQTFILDTGSAITTSPCEKCNKCGSHLNPKFKLENESKIIGCNTDNCNLVRNSICSFNRCTFFNSYSEGSSLSGFYIDQDVFFEEIDNEYNLTNVSYSIPVGCTTSENHLFKTQLADGIMGLNNNDKSFVSILYNLKVIQKNIFSLCFSQEGGYFSIGKVATSHHFSKNISYVSLLGKNSGNYYIELKYIQIGDKKILYNGRSFVDSGTTISYFPERQFSQIMTLFFEECKNRTCGELRRIKGLGYCAHVKFEAEVEEIINNGWRNIIIGFDGFDFIWKPENYYFRYNTESNGKNICLGFEGDKRYNILLGTTFMHGHDIIFDKQDNRVGFVPADCERNLNLENKIDENIKIEDINNNRTQTFNEDNKLLTDVDVNKNEDNKIIKEINNNTDVIKSDKVNDNIIISDNSINKSNSNIITNINKNKDENKIISDIGIHKINN